MRKISPTTNLSHWLFAFNSPSFVLFNVPQGCHINFADSLGIEINVPCVYFASLFNSSFWLCLVLALHRILCATHWISRMRLWFDSSKMRGQICYNLVGNSSHAHKSSPHTCTPGTCEDTERGQQRERHISILNRLKAHRFIGKCMDFHLSSEILSVAKQSVCVNA